MVAAADEHSDAAPGHSDLTTLGTKLRKETRQFRAATEPTNLDALLTILAEAEDTVDGSTRLSRQAQTLILAAIRDAVGLIADMKRGWQTHEHLLERGADFESNIRPSLDRLRDSSAMLATKLNDVADALRRA